jgi:hypothetical protein
MASNAPSRSGVGGKRDGDSPLGEGRTSEPVERYRFVAGFRLVPHFGRHAHVTAIVKVLPWNIRVIDREFSALW